MIKEERLQVFIDGANRFFNEVHATEVEVNTPYLIENKTPAAYDYTGIITINGPYQGIVYFTAPKVLLRHLLLVLEESDSSDENLKDLVGEIANTLSGNAREKYGSEFMISVPIVVRGAPDEIYLPSDSRSFVIPLRWSNYQAAIVICLASEQGR